MSKPKTNKLLAKARRDCHAAMAKAYASLATVEHMATAMTLDSESVDDSCAEATANLAMFQQALADAFLMIAAANQVALQLNIAVQAAQIVKDSACTIIV